LLTAAAGDVGFVAVATVPASVTKCAANARNAGRGRMPTSSCASPRTLRIVRASVAPPIRTRSAAIPTRTFLARRRDLARIEQLAGLVDRDVLRPRDAAHC